MKKADFLSVPENAVFWLLLLFMAAGSAASLYSRASGRVVAAESGRVISPIYAASQDTRPSKDKVLSHISTGKPLAALTFTMSDGIHSLDTLLGALDACDAKATFFLASQWVADYPDAVVSIADAGHEIGIQSESLSRLRKMTRAQIRSGLEGTEEQILALTGTAPVYFRPPDASGESPEASAAIEAASSLGYTSISWDCDSLDWKDYGADAIAEEIASHPNLASGSILLFHGDAKYTADAMEQTIEGLWKRGLAPASISQLLPEAPSRIQ